MACVDEDIKSSISLEVKKYRIPGTDFDMVYYADDTIIASRNLEASEELIERAETISAQYGLALNRDKCVST